MSEAKHYPPDHADLLFEMTKWWILMLSTVTRRMGTYLDRQAFIERTLSHEGEIPITDYFTEAEISDMVVQREHPHVVQLRLQADAFFVASALYQLDGLLQKLSSQSTWRGNLASAGNEFRILYKENRLGELRNFIEHANEHIANAKHDIATDFAAGFGIKMWGATKRFSGGVDSFSVFGSEYQVIRAVEAAQRVLDYLPNVTNEDLKIVSGRDYLL